MEEMKMAKLTTAEFIEAIKELSVLELNELVKACEEEFGVSAAAGVVVAAAGPAAGSAAVSSAVSSAAAGGAAGANTDPDYEIIRNAPQIQDKELLAKQNAFFKAIIQQYVNRMIDNRLTPAN